MHPTCETAVGWASAAHGCAREAPPITMVKHCCVLMYHFVKFVHCTTVTPHCTIEPPPSDNPVLLSIRRDRVWETEVSQNPIRFKYRKKIHKSGRDFVIISLFFGRRVKVARVDGALSSVLYFVFRLLPIDDHLYFTFLDFDPPQ